MNIAVITRDPVLPVFLERPLGPRGHRLVVVPELGDLGRVLAEIRPSAVLVPRRLPALELPAAIAKLRAMTQASRTSAAPLPVIVIGVDASDKALARAAGADGFLLIPFSDAEVLEVIGATTRKKKLILLADDSAMIHRHTVPILEDAGYEVLGAMDGAQALELCLARAPDLVITDIEMPKLDGYDVCKAIKASQGLQHIPVLISSTLGDAADLERGFDAGADDYLIKPVMAEELLTRVRTLMSSSLPASRERILVVDDSPAQRHYVADCLARQGFDIVTAEDGRIGLERARELRPALIISDYDMPEMNGFELVHALKRDVLTRNMPVIMLSARESKRDMAQMRAAGASAYLVKPFAQDKCIAMVERTLAERRLLNYKQASSVYISEGARQAAEERAADGDLAAVRADEHEMTVLFTDIVGFTRLAGQLSPRQVIDLLNDYFDVLCPLIIAEGGDIDKLIGDAVMAVFGELRGREQPAARAVRAAMAMQAAITELNAAHPVEISMRIGINTGMLVRGDLGSRFVRRDYTVIGDTVNRASRYEAACPPGKVMISESTRDKLGDLVSVQAMPGLTLEGVSEPVVGYIVLALGPGKERPE